MDDSKGALRVTEAKLTDGTTVAVNDHVYLTPEHLGEPYYIGRIMEFCEQTNRRRGGLQARIAWFNRPRDVISRKSYDPRLLVATMHSDLNPVSAIRGKCTVKHKSHISPGKLEEYKRLDDHFYYHQLYDRYMQRVYDIIPSELVQNIPTNIQQALRERYQFVVVEQGKVADLTVPRRTCCVCQNWCASQNSVRCAACQKNYHMSCLNPPLLRKPTKGFAWQCAFCTRKEVVDVDMPQKQHPEQQSHQGPEPPQPTQKRQTRHSTRGQKTSPSIVITPPAIPESEPLKLRLPFSKIYPGSPAPSAKDQLRMTNMWPFRYFGVNTDINAVLDIDDRIYPRAQSRIGSRYQADIIPELESTPPTAEIPTQTDHQPSPPPRAIATPRFKAKRLDKRGKSRYKRRIESSPGVASLPDEEMSFERGTNETITPLFHTPDRLDEATLDKYMADAKALPDLPLPPYSGDLMDRILLELEHHDYDPRAALEAVSKLTRADFEYLVDWTDKEVEAFEEGIKTYGHDLCQVGRMVPTKRPADVVRYFYWWKKTARYEPVYSQWTKIYMPAKRFKKSRMHGNNGVTSTEGSGEEENSDGESDNGEDPDPTVVRASQLMARTFHCSNCHAIDSPIWRRLPTDIDRKRKQFRQVLCNHCGEFWLKYSIMLKVSSERGVRGGKMRSPKAGHGESVLSSPRQGMKRKRISEDLFTKSNRRIKDDKSVLMYAPSACAVCSKMEPDEKLLTCYDCGMSVHHDCFGASTTHKEGWTCDVCNNKKNPTASYAYQCILCKAPRDTPCQPLKKTSLYNWAHVLCAMFTPEVKFVNTETLHPVEYIGAIKPIRWQNTCQLCNKQEGVCLQCDGCNKYLHMSCAKEHGYKVGFEIAQSNAVHEKHEDENIIDGGLFGSQSSSGVLEPRIYCPDHTQIPRLYDLSTRTVTTQESCLRVYSTQYKGVEPGSTPAMRRYRAVLEASGIDSQETSASSLSSVSTSSDNNNSLIETPDIDMTELCKEEHGKKLPRPATQIVHPSCSECPIKYSPYWWQLDATSTKVVCQRCYWSHRQQEQTNNLIA